MSTRSVWLCLTLGDDRRSRARGTGFNPSGLGRTLLTCMEAFLSTLCYGGCASCCPTRVFAEELWTQCDAWGPTNCYIIAVRSWILQVFDSTALFSSSRGYLVLFFPPTYHAGLVCLPLFQCPDIVFSGPQYWIQLSGLGRIPLSDLLSFVEVVSANCVLSFLDCCLLERELDKQCDAWDRQLHR